MGLVDELKDLHPAALAAIAIVGGGVLLVVLVAVLVVVAAILGTFVLGMGEEVEETVQAGASVGVDEDAGEVVVTFTSNQNADHLRVEWEGAVSVSGSSDGATRIGDGAVRLSDVGDEVTLQEDDPGTDTTVRVTVTAVGEAGESVVVEREITV